MKFLLLILILLTACGTETTEKNTNPTHEEITRLFTYGTSTVVKILPSTDKPGKLNVEILYPDETFDPGIGTKPITNRFATTLDLIYSQKMPVDRVTITVKEHTVDGRLIGTFEISMGEVQKLKETYQPLPNTVRPYLKLDEKFQVEVKLLGNAKNAQNVNVKRINNKTTDETIISIDFDLERKKIKNEWEQDPLDNLGVFENLVATLIRIGFEADESIDRVNLRADLTEIDNRWNESTLIAKYWLDRKGFIEIDENWDNLRFKIYDKIEYGPLFLADFVSESTVLSIGFGDQTKILLFYEEEFETIDKTLGVIEKDAASIIKNTLQEYETVDNVQVIVKAKVPAEEGMVSSDGIHQIIHEFMIVSADRRVHDGLDYEELNDKQILYNFDVIYHAKASELAIMSNLFGKSTYFRSIDVDDDTALLDIDACIFITDKDMDSKIKEAKRQSDRGEDASVEDTVAEIIFNSAKKLVYDIHPPYLEEVTFELTVVYLDTTGNEIDTRELGGMTFVKDDDTNYWFQTEDPSELVWVEVDTDTINIDDDEFFCQS